MREPWSTDDFGCKYNDSRPRSLENRRAEAVLDEQVYHDGERWVAPLLRREEEKPFEPSYDMALKRARCFERKLDKSEALTKMCFSKFQEMENNGHFRKLTAEEAEEEPPNTWYLPLLAVTNEKKPGKVRLVLDAAAKSKDVCLNDYLMQGPENMNSLPGVLLRWREWHFRLCSDVKAMFSQIKMSPQDTPSLRFLWRGDRREGPFDVYESPVLIFGAKSSPSIAGYCFRRTADEFASPEVASLMKRDTYVDDVITGANEEHAAVELARDIATALRGGGFELSEWTSNSAQIKSHLEAEKVQRLQLEPATTKTLGLTWMPRLDMLTYESRPDDVDPVTKRTIMSQTMQIFDALGYLNGWILNVRLIIHKLWQLKYDWDDEVPDDVTQR